MDIEVVSVDPAEPPDACSVAFDVIYAGETWCRSLVWIEAVAAAGLENDQRALVSAARGTLLELLAYETVPVSLHLRLTAEGTTVLARGTPGGGAQRRVLPEGS